MRRHTREHPCGICGGHEAMPQGKGERCWGRTASDEREQVWVTCTREQYAGALQMRSTGYPHLVRSVCDCEEQGYDPEHCRCHVCGCGVTHESGAVAPPRPVDYRERERKTAAKRRIAERIWSEALPARGTLVETYLCARGISLAVPSRLRFYPRLLHRPPRMQEDTCWPGMVALVTDVQDRRLGVHRTFLARDGRGKAPVEPAKMMLGPIQGGAVRLVPAAEQLLIAEGIETALAASELWGGLPAWAALSAGGIERLVLPDMVRSVVIAADHDASMAGEHAALAAEQRWIAEGRAVEVYRPEVPGDFADVLETTGRAAACLAW